MRVSFDMKCPGCQAVEPVRCVKPGFMKPSEVAFTCSICQSKVFVTASQSDKAGRVETKAKLFPSELLERAWREEAELRADEIQNEAAPEAEPQALLST